MTSPVDEPTCNGYVSIEERQPQASPREVENRLVTILGLIVEALDCAGSPVSVCTIEAGNLPNGEHACDGHAWIRLISGGIMDPFPQQSIDPKKCGPPGFLVGAGVMRCVPTMDSNAKSPLPADITRSGIQQIRDMSTILSVIRDHYPFETGGAKFRLVPNTWEPIEPIGAIAGGEWSFYMDALVCSRCGLESSA